MRNALVRCLVAPLALVGLFSAASMPAARANQVFHSEHINLLPVAGAPLRSGFVIDIHANGQQVYALERYVLNGALPNATYQVVDQIYTDPQTCTALLLANPTAMLQTNGAGNGESGIVIRPAVVAGFGNITLGIVWQVLHDRTVAYQSGCISVALGR